MADVQHSTLTDPYLHEPKGVSTASKGQVYVADGSGSGVWRQRFYILTARIDNISNVASIYVPVPYAGVCKRVLVTLGGAISGADDTVTARNSLGSSLGTITVPYSSSAAGDTHFVNPTVNNVFSDNSHIVVETDGASSSPAQAWVTIVMEQT